MRWIGTSPGYRSSPPAERASADRQALGRAGERVVARYLEESGYRVLARNWRARRYELDIVAIRDTVVSFVEVKTRTPGPQDAAESLTAAQRRRIRRAAEAWIHAHPGVGREFRFDLALVRTSRGKGATIELIPDAFFGDEHR